MLTKNFGSSSPQDEFESFDSRALVTGEAGNTRLSIESYPCLFFTTLASK